MGIHILTWSGCFITFSPIILAIADPQFPDPTIHIFFPSGMVSTFDPVWRCNWLMYLTCVSKTERVDKCCESTTSVNFNSKTCAIYLRVEWLVKNSKTSKSDILSLNTTRYLRCYGSSRRRMQKCSRMCYFKINNVL